MGRWGDGEMGRWGDGEMGRWGDGEMGRMQYRLEIHQRIKNRGKDSFSAIHLGESIRYQ
jgi:hypothetical protein